MSMRLYVAANGMGPVNKGSIVVVILQWPDRFKPRYKLSSLLFYFIVAQLIVVIITII